MQIVIIVSKFNSKITDRLLKGAEKGLQEMGIKSGDWQVFDVPGAFEIPYMAQKLIDTEKFDGLIALGCILKGETDHYRAVCEGVTYGIQKVSVENRVPVMFGVLMCNESYLANRRSGENNKNKGYQCAKGLAELLKTKGKS